MERFTENLRAWKASSEVYHFDLERQNLKIASGRPSNITNIFFQGLSAHLIYRKAVLQKEITFLLVFSQAK